MLSVANAFQLKIRSGLFYVLYVVLITLFSFGMLLMAAIAPFNIKAKFLAWWGKSCVWSLRVICGVKFNVTGAENLPKDQPYVVLSKHQSQWETYFLMQLLAPVSIICKKELLKIPGFGYCLSQLKPIPIDRSNPKQALRDIQTIGLQRLTEEKIPVLIFPEGTRTDLGKKGKYARGGAALAIAADVPVVFISHNAAYCWPSDEFVKLPGTVEISISEPINPAGMTARELTLQAEQWIESRVVYRNDSDKPA